MKITNIYNDKRDIYTFYRDNEMKLHVHKIDGFFPYFYEKDISGSYKSFKGESLKKIIVSMPQDIKRKRSKQAFEADILFTRRFLIDKVDILEKCPIKYFMVDIEIQTIEFPSVKDAKYPVSCISIYNSENKEVKIFFLPDFASEYELYQAFVRYIKAEKPDILLGWNFVNFDYKYLHNRFPDLAKDISPIGKSRYRAEDTLYPAGISICDYMDWFKKTTLNREKRYSLDYISQKYLKDNEIITTDFNIINEELKRKNINDVVRLAKLEERFNLLGYCDEIRRLAKVEFEDLEWNSRMIDQLLLQEAKEQKVVLPMRPEETEEVEFEGAYRDVLESGAFFNVYKADLSSAYPFAIIDFCIDSANIVENETTSNEEVVNVNNILFRQKPDALLPKVVRKLVTLKDEIKRQLKAVSSDSENYKDIKTKYDAVKGLVNSAYGVMGNRFFRLYDNRVASSTTYLVRSLLKYVIEKLGTMGHKVVYVDTDSVFYQADRELTVELNALIQQWAKEMFDKERVSTEFAHEGTFEKLLLLTKCRYAGWLRKTNGELEEEIKGIEAKRKDSSVYTQKFQKELIERILNKEEKDIIFNWIKTEIDNFQSQKLEDIAFPCRISKPASEYKNLPVFIRAQQSTPQIKINIGDSFYYIYMRERDEKGNDVVLAFTEENNEHINREKIDWQKMKERNLIMKLDTIFEAMKYDLNEIYTPPAKSRICTKCEKEKTNGRFDLDSDICKICVTNANKPPKIKKVKIIKEKKIKIKKESVKKSKVEVSIEKTESIIVKEENQIIATEELIEVSHSFKTQAEITDRTIIVAEAFGLGIDEEKSFTLYDKTQIKFKVGDVVYITGDSGSGKSFLLNNVFAKREDAISLSDLKIDDNEQIIEGVGKDINEALKLLNLAGLGDAFLYLRKYSQLSDGQKYRYKIAKFIANKDKKIWLIDEAGATLDRTTAKIVSFNLQKIARQLGKSVIIATTHTDLLDEIRPNVLIVKGYESEVNITYYTNEYWKNKKLDMLDEIKYEIGTKEDYEKLKKFHYRQASLGAVRGFYKMTYKDELVGVIVTTYPHLALKGRNKFNNNELSKMSKENCERINAEYTCIARVIIHPKYRGIGLAYRFIGKYLDKWAETKYVETLAVMARYSKFFHKAGMIPIEVDEDLKRHELVALLEQYGYNISLLSSAKYNEKIYNNLTDEQKIEVKNIVKNILSKYKGQISKLYSTEISVDDLVNKNLFILMKDLQRPDTLYLVKKVRD